MILGYSHLSLSTIDMAESEKALLQQGYEREFLTEKIPNHPAKRQFLGNFEAFHDIALYSHKTKPTIEVIKHGDTLSPGLGAFGCNGDCVSLRTTSGEDLSFYTETLSFVQGDGNATLQIKSPIAAWSLAINVRETGTTERSNLDSSGYPVMALWCRKLEERLDLVKAAGVTECTDPFLVTVNDREIKVALFRSPGGGIFELMEFKSP